MSTWTKDRPKSTYLVVWSIWILILSFCFKIQAKNNSCVLPFLIVTLISCFPAMHAFHLFSSQLIKKTMNSIYTIICKFCSKLDRETKALCRVIGKLVLQLSKSYVLLFLKLMLMLSTLIVWRWTLFLEKKFKLGTLFCIVEKR